MDTFTRAAVAAGPSFPAVESIGEDQFRLALERAYADALQPGLGLRITSEFGWLTATR
jgi:hypothetical protein